MKVNYLSKDNFDELESTIINANQSAAIVDQLIKFNNMKYNSKETYDFKPLEGLSEEDFNELKSTIINTLINQYAKKMSIVAGLMQEKQSRRDN